MYCKGMILIQKSLYGHFFFTTGDTTIHRKRLPTRTKNEFIEAAWVLM